MRSLQDLMAEAKWGELSREELNYVVQRIKNFEKDPNQEDLSDLLYILGRSGASEYRGLLEKYLRYSADYWVCSRALEGLCRYYGLTKDYLEDLKFYLIGKGADWDIFDDIRIRAIGLAGEYLMQSYDRDLLALLLDIFENLGKAEHIQDTEESSRALLRSWAYSQIAQAMGVDSTDIDMDRIESSLENGDLDSIDLSVIEKAKKMILKTT